MHVHTVLQVETLSFSNALDEAADLPVMRLIQGDRDNRSYEFGGHCEGKGPAMQGIGGQLIKVNSEIMTVQTSKYEVRTTEAVRSPRLRADKSQGLRGIEDCKIP